MKVKSLIGQYVERKLVTCGLGNPAPTIILMDVGLPEYSDYGEINNVLAHNCSANF